MKEKEYNELMEEILEEDSSVKEAAEEYFTKQGSYTLDDYYALPEDMRVELIEGYFFAMLAPGALHQLAVGEIYRQIANFIVENGGKCQHFVSPTDVQLNKDNKTMVEPDVFIMCKEDVILDRCIYGAPDFVLEVLSKSTEKKDKTKKVSLYKNAGVREYWILDLDRRLLMIYLFEKGDYIVITGLDEPQPIRIYEGRLVINFEYINQMLDKYNRD